MQSSTAAGLVLEGGGLRGNFTAGVLRHFTDMRFDFSSVYGVSMGACNGANVVSKQPERNRITNTRFVNDSRYLSYLRLLKGGDLFGMDFIFRDVPLHIVPIDYETFKTNPVNFWIGVTDCHTGEAVMFEKGMLESRDDVLTVMRASASLPLVAKPVEFNGAVYMDGGIANPIPLQQSLEHGEKPVVILTQQAGYRKGASKSVAVCKWRYPQFSGLIRVLEHRHEQYNDMLATIEAKEKSGEIFVIRPESTLGVGRVCRDQRKLYELYDNGYTLARKCTEALQEFLSA
ncbi:patatin-like phospholipase family protein [Halodesulfovibrio marinisediminis]|uniref:Predicted phospholipase, patatin/cPLA2 family n=1 Tax=Halodesulfovibrio marinisediminis DSM 17456 TaxID=1121457 RepID=A0A1N6GWJ7_9BACT|nr:patatin family protein [Halodesulfovibrio marinisediminis]SIO11842.1 Predicted phospholipase, patatin/cPLA2 family [Halodesulfovibrio marinisediminis DSM 17456]